MREIGGYFGLECFSGKEYYNTLIRVNTARSGMLHIIKKRRYNKIYIPFMLCGSISSMLKANGVSYERYHVDEDLLPVFNKKLNDDECILIVNYYDCLSKDKILKLSKQYKNIILDNVQAFFHHPLERVDTIYSCRKFFGVPDGGYVYTDDDDDDSEYIPEISFFRMSHLLGRIEFTASKYYDEFKKNDNSFSNVDIKGMSVISQNILKAVDYKKVKEIRNSNFEYLKAHFQDKLFFPEMSIDGPFAFPLYSNNSDELRQCLISKKIYVPCLWPDISKDANSFEKGFVKNVIPLPIDQRYNYDDMDKIIGILDEFT